MKLWTGWMNYSATGEGQIICAVIAYAESKSDIILTVKDKFGDFSAYNSEYAEGIIRNEITQFLFTEKALALAEKAEGQAKILMYSESHINTS